MKRGSRFVYTRMPNFFAQNSTFSYIALYAHAFLHMRIFLHFHTWHFIHMHFKNFFFAQNFTFSAKAYFATIAINIRMKLFNELYCLYIESTRRDFLKQIAGTAAAATHNPGASKIIDAASSAHYSPAAFNFGYEISNATTIPSLTQLFKSLWDARKRKYTSDELKQHVEKSAKTLASGKPLDAKTALMLAASDPDVIAMSVSLKARQAARYTKNINASTHLDYEKFYDEFLEEHLDMLMDFFATGDTSFFANMWPLDIMFNNKVILSKQQAISRGIFSPVSQIKSNVEQYAQQAVKRPARRPSTPQIKNRDDIEYAPADYKGAWQHDADYQSLSMGESFNAGDTNKRQRTK